MADPSSTSSQDHVANLPTLALGLSNSLAHPIHKPLQAVFDYLESLRERGQEEMVEEIDNSKEVTRFGQDPGTKPVSKVFNDIWSEKEFRKVLYGAVNSGGPPWLGQAITMAMAENMRLSGIPHVWAGLFQKVTTLTDTLFGPASEISSHAAEVIAYTDLLELQTLCIGENGSLDLGLLEELFFPKERTKGRPKKSQGQPQTTASSVTGKRYEHGRSTTFMVKCLTNHWGHVFDCLAGHAVRKTPLRPHFDCLNFVKLVPTSGNLTNSILCHITSWFESPRHSKGQPDHQSYPWTTRLAAGPFYHRDDPNSTDETPAQRFVQELFDMTREYDQDRSGWKECASQTPEAFDLTVCSLPKTSQGVRYRHRFRHREWTHILVLVKRYTDRQFIGHMEPFNEMLSALERPLRISLFASVEHFLEDVQVACPPELLIFENEEVRRGFITETKVFLAGFLHQRIKTSVTGDQKATSSAQGPQEQPEAQSINQASDAAAQAVLTEIAQILRDDTCDDAGDNIEQSTLQHSLPLRQSQRDETADDAAVGVTLTDSQLAFIDDGRAESSHLTAPLGSESPLSEGSEPPGKKRKRSAQE